MTNKSKQLEMCFGYPDCNGCRVCRSEAPAAPDAPAFKQGDYVSVKGVVYDLEGARVPGGCKLRVLGKNTVGNWELYTDGWIYFISPCQTADFELRMTASEVEDYVTTSDPTDLAARHCTPPAAVPNAVPDPRPVGWRMQHSEDSQRRKDQPVFAGFLQYMPAAIRLASELSRIGNEKHNPGEPMYHNRSKSSDNGEALVRHQMDVGQIDPDTDLDYAVHVFWRAGIQLQVLCETKYGWPKAPGAK